MDLVGVERLKEVALKIGHIQRDSGLPDPPLDFVEQLNFGLVLVVFEWAKGVSFSEIARMTDVQVTFTTHLLFSFHPFMVTE